MKENKTLEFKLYITNTFLKTVSAYSNFGTGLIVFGVNDNGENIGVKDPEQLCLDIENKINDSISPKPDYTMSINWTFKTVSLKVFEGDYKPYLYKGKAYRRSDLSTVEVDRIELKRLILEGNNLSFEQLPYKDNELSFHILKGKCENVLNINSFNLDILKTFGFITKKGDYNNAAALFADYNSFYGVDIARFGTTIDDILDRQTYTNISLLDLYDKTIEMIQKYYQYESIDGIERRKKELIPEKAYREAIANALVHRTWDVNMFIRIEMYNDRIEISSPGGLPNEISEEDYLQGQISYLRNPIVGNIFYRFGLIEMFGTGIRRIQNSYKAYDRKPKFEITSTTIKVILPIIERSMILTTEEELVVNQLRKGIQMSSSELVRNTGLTKYKIIKNIQSLKEKGYVKSIGNGKGIRYLL